MDGFLKATALKTILEYEHSLITAHVDFINKLMTHLCDKSPTCPFCEQNKKFHEDWQKGEKGAQYNEKIALLKQVPEDIKRFLHLGDSVPHNPLLSSRIGTGTP